MKHIKDTEGVIHYEWTKDKPDDTTLTFCCQISDNALVETEDDVNCPNCLHDVALYTDPTYKKGDLVYYSGLYALINDLDPTFALVQLECQDGFYSWDVPSAILKRVTKENKPAVFWRMKRTPHLNRMKFWVGRNFGSSQGAFITGECHSYNGMTEENAIRECVRMLKAYTNLWQK